jgi:hypothetical protein
LQFPEFFFLCIEVKDTPEVRRGVSAALLIVLVNQKNSMILLSNCLCAAYRNTFFFFQYSI